MLARAHVAQWIALRLTYRLICRPLSFATAMTSGKVVAYALFVVLLAPVAVTAFWLQLRKAEVRREVKHKLMAAVPKESLVRIALPAADTLQVRWEHSEEFERNGEMYDVAQRTVLADSIVYYCWWDREETQLNQALTQLTGRYLAGDAPSRENGGRIVVFLRQLALPPPALALDAQFAFRSKLHPSECGRYLSPDLEATSPPPDCPVL